MTWSLTLVVFAGGVVGGGARAVLDWLAPPRRTGAVPWGIVVANLAGSALLGVLSTALAPGSTALILVGTGFCGALTTFSTFSVHLAQLMRTSWRHAVLYLVVSVGGGLALALVGRVLGQVR